MSDERTLAQAAPAPDHAPFWPNCDAVPLGPWCQQCGQKAGHVHRSMPHLGSGFVETLTHADSRLWRTLRRLALDPGRLARDYLGGHRVAEIPPLRQFVVMLFLLFGLSTLGPTMIVRLNRIEPGVRPQIAEQIGKITISASPNATRWLRAHLLNAVETIRTTCCG